MDLEFFIYGAPKGNSYNGKEEEKRYFDSMYNGSSKINEIQIEIRKSGASQKMYCYYNYLIRQNVVDKDGRPGSFFGFSLRSDVYWVNFHNIYRILDTVYHTYINKELLRIGESKVQFLVENFNDPALKEIIKDIEKATVSLLRTAFEENSTITLDNNFSPLSKKRENVYLYDFNNQEILNRVKTCGCLNLSLFYPSISIQEIQRQHSIQLQDIQKQYDNSIKQYKNNLNINRTEIDKLNKIINTAQQKEAEDQNTIRELNSKVDKFDTELKKYSKLKTITEQIAIIKDPIQKIANYLTIPETQNGKQTSQEDTELNNEPKKGKTKTIIKFLFRIIPLINLVLLVIVLLYLKGKNIL